MNILPVTDETEVSQLDLFAQNRCVTRLEWSWYVEGVLYRISDCKEKTIVRRRALIE